MQLKSIVNILLIFLWTTTITTSNMKYCHLKQLILCDNPKIDPFYNDYYNFIKREDIIQKDHGYDERFPKREPHNISSLLDIINNEKRLETIRKLESIKTLPEEKKIDVIQDTLDEYANRYRLFNIKGGGLYKNWLLDDW